MDYTHKIFKYPLIQENSTFFATLPKKYSIIRTDYVSDPFNEGFFVWAIVDPEEKQTVLVEVDYKPSDFSYKDHMLCKQIGFLEEQCITLPHNTIFGGLHTYAGKLYLYYYSGNPFAGITNYKIILRKTGQEIGYPIDYLKYINWGYLYILQELAVYGFIVTSERV